MSYFTSKAYQLYMSVGEVLVMNGTASGMGSKSPHNNKTPVLNGITHNKEDANDDD